MKPFIEFKILLLFFQILLSVSTGFQIFLPVQNNADSIFGYEMFGATHIHDNQFTIKSLFDLHIRHDSENQQLRLHIMNPKGKVGQEDWTDATIAALKLPFNITLNASGAPANIECHNSLETNYTMARKIRIWQELKDIYEERQKHIGTPLAEYTVVQKLDETPFGICSTRINASLSLVYFTINYEAKRSECVGKVDPFFTMDMNVDVYPQSEFLKSFGFTKKHLDFQFIRLDGIIKLQTNPEIDVEIYTLITLKEIFVDPQEPTTTEN